MEKAVGLSDHPLWRKVSALLLSHLDNKTSKNIIGYEGDYEKAIAALERHYNNHAKMVASCTRDINAFLNIEEGDYEGLVSYKTCIIKNHAQLTATGLQHKVSNSEMMQKLMSNLPWGQLEKWGEYFEEQEVKLNSS